MAKLIHILAASVGGGLVLGASIRLGEAIGVSAQKRERPEARKPDLTNRLEQKVQTQATRPSGWAPKWQSAFASVTARVDRQQAEMQALRNQITIPAQPRGTATEPALDLHRQISDELDRRLAGLEEKFHLTLEAANRETVEAMVSSIERKLASKIHQLEVEISDQSAAVAALRDCSLQSERSIQRLLTVMERTLSSKGLSVVSGRGQDETDEGGATSVRRPISR